MMFVQGKGGSEEEVETGEEEAVAQEEGRGGLLREGRELTCDRSG